MVDVNEYFSSGERTLAPSGNTMPLTKVSPGTAAACSLGAPLRDVVILFGYGTPNASVSSMESWTGHCDVPGNAGDLAQKPSMIMVQLGEARAHVATRSLRGAQ